MSKQFNLMSKSEAELVARNIEMIEKALKGPVPLGFINTDEFRNHLLNRGEAELIAFNIEQVYGSRRPRPTFTEILNTPPPYQTPAVKYVQYHESPSDPVEKKPLKVSDVVFGIIGWGVIVAVFIKFVLVVLS